MARLARIHHPGCLYHVMLRGNDRQEIFFGNEDRDHFFQLVGEGVERYGYRVHAYCCMTNHVHLTARAETR